MSPLLVVLKVVGEWHFSLIHCDILLTLDVMMCTASILNLCAISIDRWILLYVTVCTVSVSLLRLLHHTCTTVSTSFCFVSSVCQTFQQEKLVNVFMIWIQKEFRNIKADRINVVSSRCTIT